MLEKYSPFLICGTSNSSFVLGNFGWCLRAASAATVNKITNNNILAIVTITVYTITWSTVTVTITLCYLKSSSNFSTCMYLCTNVYVFLVCYLDVVWKSSRRFSIIKPESTSGPTQWAWPWRHIQLTRYVMLWHGTRLRLKVRRWFRDMILPF